jgi:dipeptidyl aminopeptidase/acylaminoacyl peptidase
MKAYSYLLLLALLPATHASAADSAEATAAASPLAPYLKKDKFGTIRISPTGEFLAVTVPLEDRTSLVILRRSDMSMTGHVTLPKNTHVGEFQWVNPTRVLFSIGEKMGDLEQPRGTGELFGVNADGSGQGPALIGFRSNGSGSRQIGASVIDDLRNDDDFVLVSIAGEGGFTEVDRMNVKNGHHIVVCRAPVRNAGFVTDPNAEVRFAVGADPGSTKSKTYYRASDKAEWQLINDESVTNRRVIPVGFTADGKTAYLRAEETSGPDGIYTFDTATNERKLLLRDDNADPSNFYQSPVDDSIYAVSFMDGLPRTETIDAESPYAKQLSGLQAGFDGQKVVPLGFTKDGNLGLYLAYSDRVPGDFYLFDRSSGKATYVASKNGWFKPEMLNSMQPISLKARDGTDLQGYLTLPRGSTGKNLPLVINPHGGPFGPFDAWGYNPEVQLIAEHGYAVLQVNYRGSGNYGRAFTRSGYQQWGGTMQDDLTDATRWAISQGIANANRICIYGASYGGYAALMGVAKEPTLYKCAIGYVGVYDMAAMYHQGDIADSTSGQHFLEEALGKQNLDAISPDRLANRIKVPVMLAAGKADVRAPAVHTEKMRDALMAVGIPVETTLYEGEGHGNYLLKNTVDFYTKLLAFLDRNIGPAVAPAAAATTPASK